MSRDRHGQLPGKRVDMWMDWLRAIDRCGRSRNDQRTRKRKVKATEKRRWRRRVDRGEE